MVILRQAQATGSDWNGHGPCKLHGDAQPALGADLADWGLNMKLVAALGESAAQRRLHSPGQMGQQNNKGYRSIAGVRFNLGAAMGHLARRSMIPLGSSGVSVNEYENE